MLRIGVYWSGLMYAGSGWGVPGDIIIDLANELGLKAIQFNLYDWGGEERWKYHVAGLLSPLDVKRYYELQSFLDRNKLEPDIRISPLVHPSKRIGELYFKRNLEELKLCKFLGAKTVISHGIDFYWTFRINKDVARELIETQLSKVAQVADSFGLRVALEMDTIYFCKLFDSKEILEIVENARKKTGLDNIGIHMDAVNATFTPGESALERARIWAPYVFAGHVKDSILEDGVWKDCLPREGVTPWKEIVNILKDAKCNAVLVLEHHQAKFLKDYTYLPRRVVKEATIKSLQYMRSLGLDF